MFLAAERETLEAVLPKLDAALAEVAFERLEGGESPAVALFRSHRGPSLLLPERFGGIGASALQAVRAQRALASRAPSLGVAATMHAFSLSTIVEYSMYGDEGNALLEAVGQQQLLLASGFAEGRTGASILEATLRAEPAEGGYRLNGAKKPCSLSRSMDILTASVAVVDAGGGRPRRAVAMVPAGSDGIERRPFWRSPVLAAAESDEVILRDVVIPEMLLFFPQVQETLDPVEVGGFLWFELLVSATYLGVASALVERVLAGGRGESIERTQLAIELEGAMSALEGLAAALEAGERASLLPRALLTRYAVQGAIERALARGVELLGGMAFIGSGEVSYLASAARALAFHPPSRTRVAAPLARHLAGERFEMP